MLVRMLLVVLLTLTNAFSYEGEYRVGLFKDTEVDYQKVTHIILVGSAAKEDSDQFFQSGMSRAIRYKEVFPTHQVIIMSSPEVVDRDDEKVFADFQINVIKFVKSSFDQGRMISEIAAFKKIQSLDYYGHSSPWGLKLGKKDTAFDPSSIEDKVRSLKPNFLPGAYITLNSCSSGFYIAPKMSELLEIPVAGALTSSLFERIENDGRWYKEDDWKKDNYAQENNTSFAQNYICEKTGACTRMKPSRYSYSSYWGVFEAGLSFNKFFCAFDNADKRCEKGMALSLYTFPSVKPLTLTSSKEDYSEVLNDWLCQTASDRTFFDKCKAGLKAALVRGDLVYKSHTGTELVCDFKSCNAKVVCKNKKIFGSGPRGGSCKLEATTTDAPTNTANEYLHFMQGFNLLNK